MSEKLKTEVWDVERCTGCGTCVQVCSRGVLQFREGEEHPTKRVIDKIVGLSHSILDTCFYCDKPCEESCPRLLEEWGEGKTTYVASVRTKRPSKSGHFNDVTSDILISALTNGMIDGAVLMDVDRCTLKPVSRVVTTIEEIMECVGTQYIWSPPLAALNDAVYKHQLERIAVVGTPCVIQGISRMLTASTKELEVYKKSIALTIGIFCSGVYSYDFITEEIVKGAGVPLNKIKRIYQSIKDNVICILLKDDSTKEIALSDAQKYMRKGCSRCSDFLAEMADISIGSVGAKEGYSTVIARNSKGEGCISTAVDWGLLEVDEKVDKKALKAAKEEKERRKRAQQFDSLTLLMLDALSDPERIKNARERFGALYKLKIKESVSKEVSGCGTCKECY
jgi:coenzyme F420 hydrogenase subunit beta